MIDESLNAYDLKFTWEKGKLGKFLFRGCGQMMCEIVDKLPSLSFWSGHFFFINLASFQIWLCRGSRHSLSSYNLQQYLSLKTFILEQSGRKFKVGFSLTVLTWIILNFWAKHGFQCSPIIPQMNKGNRSEVERPFFWSTIDLSMTEPFD